MSQQSESSVWSLSRQLPSQDVRPAIFIRVASDPNQRGRHLQQNQGPQVGRVASVVPNARSKHSSICGTHNAPPIRPQKSPLPPLSRCGDYRRRRSPIQKAAEGPHTGAPPPTGPPAPPGRGPPAPPGRRDWRSRTNRAAGPEDQILCTAGLVLYRGAAGLVFDMSSRVGPVFAV